MLDLDGQFAFIERFAIGMREGAYMHPQGLMGLAPNVEELCELTESSVRKHIVPPRIVFRGGHVIRHDVEQNSQTQRLRGFHEASPSSFPAQIIADAGRIRYIIAVLASGDRLETG